MESCKSPPPSSNDSDRLTHESQLIDETSLIDRFPYASRLTSNDVPSDEEMEEIKAFLQEPTEQIRQMEAEIASLRARIDHIRRKQFALENQVKTCRSLITIPRRLPDDILLEIFSRCVPEASNPTLDGIAPPLSLATVCRRWRLLTLQTPKLWSAIDLSMGKLHCRFMHEGLEHSPTSHSTKGITCMLSKWLEHSGTCALTFSLSAPSAVDLFPMDDCNIMFQKNCEIMVADCLKVLLSFADRWFNVSLTGDNQSLSAFFTNFPLPLSNFHMLESLFLNIRDYEFPHILSTSMFNAPNLRKVSIRGCSINSSALRLPWSRLTHLDLRAVFDENPIGPIISTLSTALNQCTSLIYLGLDVDHAANSVNQMYLPCLQRLSIRQLLGDQNSNTSILFIDNLKAPSLDEISLQVHNGPGEGLLVALSKHARSVQTLKLNVGYIKNSAFTDFLRHCHSLRFLHIISGESFYQDDLDFFSVLAGNDEKDKDMLCPLLQELMLDGHYCGTLSLVSFLEKKQSGDSRLLMPLGKLLITSLRENGCYVDLHESTVEQALKPFTDNGLFFRYGLQVRRICEGHWDLDSQGNCCQYAYCWRD